MGIPHTTDPYHRLADRRAACPAELGRSERRERRRAAETACAGMTERSTHERPIDTAPRRTHRARTGGRAGRQAARLRTWPSGCRSSRGRSPPSRCSRRRVWRPSRRTPTRSWSGWASSSATRRTPSSCSGGAGADVDGERVRFPRGLCRQLVQATAPQRVHQDARNPANNVQIGGDATVLAPAYGSPFVLDIDQGRRYGTIEDFRNFVKLAYMSPVPAPLGRHRVRAGRPAGQQAPLRHGVRPHAVLGQAVHGLGHPSATRRGHRRHGADPVRRRLPRDDTWSS